jgi:hypothetical protein
VAFVNRQRNEGLHEMALVFMMIFVALLLAVVLCSFALKFVLVFGRGAVIVRGEMLRELDTVLRAGDGDRRLDVAPDGSGFVVTDSSTRRKRWQEEQQRQRQQRRFENDDNSEAEYEEDEDDAAEARYRANNGYGRTSVSVVDTLWGHL